MPKNRKPPRLVERDGCTMSRSTTDKEVDELAYGRMIAKSRLLGFKAGSMNKPN